MQDFLLVLFLLSIPVFIGALIALIINACRKKSLKAPRITMGISATVGFLCIAFSVVLYMTGHWTISEHSDQEVSETTVEETKETEEPKESTTDAPAPEKEDTETVTQAEADTSTEQEQSSDDEAYYSGGDPSLAAIDDIDTGITDTLVDKGYTLDHASAIQQILNTIGIESIDIENMTGKPEEGLNSVVSFPNGYTERDRRFYFTTDNGVLFYAGFLDEDLYDSDKGGYLKNYNDVHVPEKTVTWDDLYALEEIAEPAVRGYLTYPNTANFDGFSYRIGRSDDNYQLLGSLTAKNGFGVKSTINFSVWFVKKNGTFNIDGITLDGVRVR